MKLSVATLKFFSAKHKKTVGTFTSFLGEKSFGILLLILALPSALPIPAAGYSIPFGLAIIYLSYQIFTGQKSISLPHKIQDFKLEFEPDSKFVKLTVRFFKFFEIFLRPRFTSIFKNNLLHRAVSVLTFLCGVSMCIPIPLTNTLPAIGIFLIGLALLEEDGLVLILGILGCLAGISLTGFILYTLAFFGAKALEFLSSEFSTLGR